MRRLYDLKTEELKAIIKLNSIRFTVKTLYAGAILIGTEKGKLIKKSFSDHDMTKHIKE